MVYAANTHPIGISNWDPRAIPLSVPASVPRLLLSYSHKGGKRGGYIRCFGRVVIGRSLRLSPTHISSCICVCVFSWNGVDTQKGGGHHVGSQSDSSRRSLHGSVSLIMSSSPSSYQYFGSTGATAAPWTGTASHQYHQEQFYQNCRYGYSAEAAQYHHYHHQYPSAALTTASTTTTTPSPPFR